MKRVALIACMALTLLLLVLPISAAPSGASSGDPAKAPSRGSMGFLFSANSALSFDGFADGYQAGAGFKYWLSPTFALRGLLGVEHNTVLSGASSTTTIGLGAAGEWHLVTGNVSPYIGALCGARAVGETGQALRADFYLGGLGGVEVKIYGPISVFAEYQLLASVDSNGFSLNLGTDGSGGSSALLGLAVYF
jgi:hypothetical protein